MQSSWGAGKMWLPAFRHCCEVAWVKCETYSTGLSHAASSVPHVTFSSVFQASAAVAFCQTVLCGRWVGFYEKWKHADKTKEEVPVSSSRLLKPTDGVGKGGGFNTIWWESRGQKKYFKAEAEQRSDAVSGPKRNEEGKTWTPCAFPDKESSVRY